MTFQANDGAVPGKHKVTVRAYSSSTDVSTGAPAELLAPRKYADTTTSPLTAMVQESGNTIELKLED